MLQTLKLSNENQKKSFFYVEKSLVGLNPGQILIFTGHIIT